jgi:hypothetical protein
LGAALAGTLSDGTALPMAAVMAGCACLTLGTSWMLRVPAPAA